MSIIDSIRAQLVPISSHGYPFIAACAVATILLFWLWAPLGWIALILTIFCAYFFRDPTRIMPIRDGLIVAPADGRILKVDEAVPPAEMELSEQPLPHVAIFLSLFDCHVNRSPTAGRIERVVRRQGTYQAADEDKAAEENERNGLVIVNEAGTKFGVVQIAGMIARRIVCTVREGGQLGVGERIGIIRFGSRVDVYLPAGARPLVAEGQRAVAGETVIADLSNPDDGRSFRLG